MYDATKFGVKGTDFTIRLQNANTRRYQQLVEEFRQVMNDVIDEVLGDADPNDYVRFVLRSNDFDRPLNTSYQRRSQVNGDWLSELFGKMLQSHEHLDLDNDLKFHIQHVALPRGNGLRRKVAVAMWLNISKKNCVLKPDVDYEDVPCFGYALLLATKLSSGETEKSIQTFTRCKAQVVSEVRSRFETAGVPYGPVDCSQYSHFTRCLPPNSRLIVVDAKEKTSSLLYKSDIYNPLPVDNVIPPVNNICLLLHDNHYLPLISLSAWFGRSYYCVPCEVAYKDKSRHTCIPDKKCHMCQEKECMSKPSFTVFCKHCFGAFRNSTCNRAHRENGVCQQAKSCDTCGRWFPGDVADHDCNSSYCSYCSKTVTSDHLCYLEVKQPSEVKRWKYIFYDLECTQNTIDIDTNRQVHVVNYCIAMSVCSDCPDDGPCDACRPVHTFSSLDGGDALVSFCKWAFDCPANKNATFIAHNGGSYDSHFILSYLVKNAEYPELTANGGKLLEMYVKTCKARFIDSFSFLSMPLSRFSATFNLPNVVKGTFPHLFNVVDNYKYIGRLPALHYYDPDGMKEPGRSKLIEWHREHADNEFEFSKEIHQYCQSDVALLKSGCMKFRSAFMSDTGIDPFQYCTIASACMAVLRTSHLLPNTIGRIPPNGYRPTRNFSNKSMGWITYCEKLTGVSYQHAWTDQGEKYIKDAKVWADAYYESPHNKYVMSFFGCHYHGCQLCFDKTTKNTHLNKTMGDLYRETVRWIERVTNCGYKLSIMWECQWDKLIADNDDIRQHVESYALSTPLVARDALYGGRCETFSLHAESSEESVVKYVDVQSLYPYVCKNKHYPIGHPRCLVGPALQEFGTDITKFEGIIKCTVLPPRGLHVPLLPAHVNDKLMFVLCKTCAESENQGRCTHSAQQRSLTGTWVSVELQRAVQLGYVILTIFEAWQYDETTIYNCVTGIGGLFAQYMNTFMKIKMEASGYPPECVTAADKTDYVERVRQHEGINLDADCIEFNAGRREVAKLCLNNIWGKFAQTPDRTTKEFITAPRRFFHLMSDDGIHVSDVQPINDDCLYVSYKKCKEFQTPALNTNVVIAAYVTTHARLELYGYLEKLGTRALYCDTDSVIYNHVDGMYNPPLSEFVGGMTDELDGSHIKEYVSNGPKNYAYRTADGKQVVKIKGFTLNYVASRQLTFDVMKKMAVAEQRHSITVVERPQIKKDLKRRQINTLPVSKSYQRIFDKRVRNVDNHTSLPFGFA